MVIRYRKGTYDRRTGTYTAPDGSKMSMSPAEAFKRGATFVSSGGSGGGGSATLPQSTLTTPTPSASDVTQYNKEVTAYATTTAKGYQTAILTDAQKQAQIKGWKWENLPAYVKNKLIREQYDKYNVMYKGDVQRYAESRKPKVTTTLNLNPESPYKLTKAQQTGYNIVEGSSKFIGVGGIAGGVLGYGVPLVTGKEIANVYIPAVSRAYFKSGFLASSGLIPKSTMGNLGFEYGKFLGNVVIPQNIYQVAVTGLAFALPYSKAILPTRTTFISEVARVSAKKSVVTTMQLTQRQKLFTSGYKTISTAFTKQSVYNVGGKWYLGAGRGVINYNRFGIYPVTKKLTIGGLGQELGSARAVASTKYFKAGVDLGTGVKTTSVYKISGKELTRQELAGSFKQIGTTDSYLFKGGTPTLRIYKAGGITYTIKQPNILGYTYINKPVTDIGLIKSTGGTTKTIFKPALMQIEQQAVVSQLVTSTSITKVTPAVTPLVTKGVSSAVSLKQTEKTINPISVLSTQTATGSYSYSVGLPLITTTEVIKTRSALRQVTSLISTEIQTPTQKQIPVQVQPQLSIQAQILTFKPFYPTTPILTPLNITPLKPLPLPKLLRQPKKYRGGGVFSVSVRRFGKFKSIATTRSYGQAFNIGRQRVSTTLGATFKVSGLGTGYKSPAGFYTKQTKEGTLFIEKPKYRLSTTPEIKEIQYFKKLKGGLI